MIGGGPLGCELAQAFCRLGAQATIVQDVPLFLPKEERDAAQILSDAFARDGIEVRLNTAAVNVRVENGAEARRSRQRRLPEHGRGRRDPHRRRAACRTSRVWTSRRRASTTTPAAGIRVDDFLRTTNPRIYAAGDACLEHKFTHTADASARIVVQNALFPGAQRLSALTIPWCTYTDPEIAHVGLYVREARERSIPVQDLHHPDARRRSRDHRRRGERLREDPRQEGTDRILGATIVARHAGEMINEITLAMVAGIGLRTLARVIHAYPTQAEAIRAAAMPTTVRNSVPEPASKLEPLRRRGTSNYDRLRWNRSAQTLSTTNGREATMELGMIGLGRMGANMAERLMRGGHRGRFRPKAEARGRCRRHGGGSRPIRWQALVAQLPRRAHCG